MKKFILLAAASILISGCTDANISQLTAYGKQFSVTLYSGGKEVRTWTSTGKVSTETHSDGWYFTDSITGRLIRVSGDVVVEEK